MTMADTNLPVGFEQDDEDDEFGTGTWTYADGSKRYGRDPELARELVSRGVIGPPPSLPDEPEGEPTSEAAEVPTAAVAPPAVDMEPPEASEDEATADLAPSPAAQAAEASGLRPANFQMGSQSSTSRTVSGALPKGMADEQRERVLRARDEYVTALDDQRFREAAALSARAGQAVEAGRMKELEGAAQLEQQKAREQKAKTRAKEVSETPVNSRRAWQDASFFNKALGSLAVLLGGFSSRMLGGQNAALQNIKDAMEADTRDQMESKNSQVAYWTRELGDARAGVAAAELKKWQGLKERLEANLLDEQSQQVLARGATLMKQVDLEIAGKLNELERVNYGNEVKTEQTEQSEQASFAAPKPGAGAAASTPVLSPLTTEDEAYKQAALKQVFPDLTGNQRNEAWVKFTNLADTNDRASAAAKTALEALQQYRKTNDVAGFGPLAKYIPTDFASKDAVTQRQLVGNAVFSFIKAQSGAAFTEQEYARRLEIALGKGDYDSMNTGLNMMLQDSRIAQDNMRTQAPGLFEARATLAQRQGERRAAQSAAKAEQDKLRGGSDQTEVPAEPEANGSRVPRSVTPEKAKKLREEKNIFQLLGMAD